MSSTVSLPPFHLDNRIAESPVTAMRFQLDSRVAELDDVVAGLERQLVETSARRANLRRELLRAEQERTQLFEQRSAVSTEILLASFARSEQAQTRLAVAEQAMEGLRERIEGVRMHAQELRRLSTDLVRVGDADVAVDDATARYARATRQLLQMVESDHVATEEMIAGPVEQLADAALAVELAGRRAPEQTAMIAEDVAHCRAAARDALNEMDRVLFRLRPDGIAEDGLLAPLRRLLAETESDADVRLQVVGEERRLAPGRALAAFRIVESALDNALDHGRPTTVDVVVSFSGERLVVLIRDDGEGFDVPATEARLGRTQAMGLITMRERAELEGGTVEVRSLLGVGTEVRATFPA